MEIRVNATRMDLMKLKRRKQLAERGHKLLKDKLDGLIQNFIKTSRELRDIYEQLEDELVDVLSEGVLATREVDRLALKAARLYPTMEVEIKEKIINIMGVKVPDIDIELRGDINCGGEKGYSKNFFSTLERLKEMLPKMVKLAELYKTMRKMGREIVEIKRRVNALEYVLIPELEKKVKYINMKLAEMERSNIVTRLKIKELVQEA